MILKDKNIVIGVTGSIAIYKSLELIRLYIKAGANVKVILTKGAKKFISTIAFETLSQNSILDDENENWTTQNTNNHISIGKWADIMVIAPCTANTLNKLHNGIADNILTQTMLAYNGVKLVAPAANTNMFKSPITQASIETLKLYNYKFIKTTIKELACKDIGDGAMAEVETVYHHTVRELLKSSYWQDRNVVLNGGASKEKIDSVRYISNFSSGKMASSVALALFYKGAEVCFISFKDSHNPYKEFIHSIEVNDTNELLVACQDSIQMAKENILKKPYFFGIAAISDYIPKSPKIGKMKKEDIGKELLIELVQNKDILYEIQDKNIYKIGFKAEVDANHAKNNAKKMMLEKSCDGVCLNIIDEKNTFGSDYNTIEFISSNQEVVLVKNKKINLGLTLAETLESTFDE